MDGRPTWTDCDKAGDYVVPNVLSPRDLVSRPDKMDETVPHHRFHIMDARRQFCVQYTDKMQKKQQVYYTTVNIELSALMQIAFHLNVTSDRRPKK